MIKREIIWLLGIQDKPLLFTEIDTLIDFSCIFLFFGTYGISLLIIFAVSRMTDRHTYILYLLSRNLFKRLRDFYYLILFENPQDEKINNLI